MKRMRSENGKKNVKSAVRIFLIIILLLIQILLFIFIVFYAQIRPFLRKMSTEYQSCCEQISEDFAAADSDHIFQITDAYLRGEYAYEISVNTEMFPSEQECFDEIISFVEEIDELINRREDSKLYRSGYCFSFKGEILNSDFYITVWGSPGEETNFLYFQTNIFAEYDSLNRFAVDVNSVTLELNTRYFSEDEKSFIDQQKENFLFHLVWTK